MAWREVKGHSRKKARDLLLCRFDYERDCLRFIIDGEPVEIFLDDYRPLHRRRKQESLEIAKQVC